VLLQLGALPEPARVGAQRRVEVAKALGLARAGHGRIAPTVDPVEPRKLGRRRCGRWDRSGGDDENALAVSLRPLDLPGAVGRLGGRLGEDEYDRVAGKDQLQQPALELLTADNVVAVDQGFEALVLERQLEFVGETDVDARVGDENLERARSVLFGVSAGRARGVCLRVHCASPAWPQRR
jgi:hypothetical protein